MICRNSVHPQSSWMWIKIQKQTWNWTHLMFPPKNEIEDLLVSYNYNKIIQYLKMPTELMPLYTHNQKGWYLENKGFCLKRPNSYTSIETFVTKLLIIWSIWHIQKSNHRWYPSRVHNYFHNKHNGNHKSCNRRVVVNKYCMKNLHLLYRKNTYNIMCVLQWRISHFCHETFIK